MLYQLSYAHRVYSNFSVARPAGVEPATRGLEGRCSIQLSYGRMLVVYIDTLPSCREGFPAG